MSHLDDKIITKAEDINIILFTNLEKPFSSKDSLKANSASQGITISKKDTKKRDKTEKYTTIFAEFFLLNDPSINKVIAEKVRKTSGAIRSKSLRNNSIIPLPTHHYQLTEGQIYLLNYSKTR